MGYQSWIADRLSDYGIRFIETDGWKNRGSSSFTPRGLVIHHDAYSASASASQILNTMINGRPDLSGPLCNVWIDDDYDGSGTKADPMTYIIAAGRANHAGSGGWKGLSGNSSVLGIEARNNGTGEPWTPQMLDTYYAVSAALLDGINADTGYLCGHKEWTSRKIDPAGIDCNDFRNRVESLRRGGTKPQPLPEGMEGVTMFIAIDSVALCALMGNVLFTFPDMKMYGNSKNASPNVPAITIGSDVPMSARSDLYKQLLMQHVVAVGEDT